MPSPRPCVLVFALLTFRLLTNATPSYAVSTDLVISQVYGGGGAAGAPYLNDFIEIFNSGTSSVSLSGLSVQYAGTMGTTWQRTFLSGTLAPGQYYLVQEGSVGAIGAPLPAPDATGTIQMSAGQGKVALVDGTAALTGSCPAGPSIIDFVGYGTGTDCFEGTAVAPTLNSTVADLRNEGGCIDTDRNDADFAAVAPNPRNTASTLNSCDFIPRGVGASNPDSVSRGQSTLLTVAVTPAANPPSTGITVVANLSSIGGSASQSFFDDGTNGDATAGDLTFSYAVTVGSSVSIGFKSLIASVTDAQARTSMVAIGLTVLPPPLVISQVYGGGGNPGAPYLNDFIEIFNRGPTTESLAGLSVQYAATTGSSWQRTLLSGTLMPGQYYLVQESGGMNGVPLPTPDATGTIAMSAGQGKIALVLGTAVLAGSCPLGSSIIDFVGYGAGTDCFEGTGVAPTLSNTMADLRDDAGCTDTDRNDADFTAATPNPRNSASPLNPCQTTAVPREQTRGEFAMWSVDPNPSHGTFDVSFSLPTDQSTSIELLDIAGRMLAKRHMSSPMPGPNHMRIEIPRQAPGVYLLRLRQGNRSEVRRVVVCR